MKSNQDMNIPTISVDKMIRRLGGLYISAINNGLPVRSIPSSFLWGAPGVGKSDGVRQIAEKITLETGKRTCVTDVRLLLFSPVDLTGVPMADSNRQFTEWLRPKIFDLDPSEEVINIVFLDELSAAPQSVQAAAYQITLDRTVGEHRLPENTIIIAAGNRITDKSVAFRMPNALANRMLHFQIDVDFDSWRIWAIRQKIHPLIVGYLSYDHSKLYHEPGGKEDIAYPTPRTWSFVSNLLYATGITATTGNIPDDLHDLIGSCIGIGAAIEFEGWCNVYREIPSARDIFAGKRVEYPRKPDVLYALISSMVHYASTSNTTRGELESACRFAGRFPMDYATALYKDLMEIPGYDNKLIMIPEFRSWMERQKKYM